ncbi:hypothetical protein [Paraburkholderia phytofirmans]|uniref:Uncharacterized protein n=1 Tax=Paraburkholderia phytofirmans OLGA172 TaxID=1417228 RepID=A0A160FVW1_9BURK|nr:hypothetical protein [Paraburkholderia phytofirmans]ANB77028.1 hypothetical protein AYM40_33460 [Paraburkholderia phytofirmans OLGA172]
MKSLIQAIAVAAVLAVPTVSFAQSDDSAPMNNPAVSGYGGVADDTSASGSHHPLRALDHSIHSMGHAIRASVRPDPNDGMKPIYFGAR